MIGAGRVGTALAVLLQRAGYRIVAVAGREGTSERAARYLPGVPVRAAVEAAAGADVVVLGTPDDRIAEACEAIAGALHAGQGVVHLSGATSLDSLSAARRAGAQVLSTHPLQTFPDVEAALRLIPGSAVAVTADDEEGYALGERLAVDAGGRPFRLPDEVKPLYHAAAVFASNYLVATQAAAEELYLAAGLPDPLGLFLPLSRATLENVKALGPAGALTGPAVRGDAGTLVRNLEAIAAHRPRLVPAYVAMARVSLDLAERAGRLSEGERTAVEEVLAKWT